ncbi:MAG: hypothetical protein ACPGTP_05625, partial [Bacteroidia bacterium]
PLIVGILLNQPLTSESLFFTVLLSLIVIVSFGVKVIVQVDVSNLKYRQNLRIYGLMLGKWSTVSEFNYISIFPTLGKTEQMIGTPIMSGGIIESVKKEIRINIIYNGNRRLQVHERLNIRLAREFALQLGSKLGLKVYDCTGPENVWLEP